MSRVLIVTDACHRVTGARATVATGARATGAPAMVAPGARATVARGTRATGATALVSLTTALVLAKALVPCVKKKPPSAPRIDPSSSRVIDDRFHHSATAHFCRNRYSWSSRCAIRIFALQISVQSPARPNSVK